MEGNTTVTFEELINRARAGAIDIAGFQRLFMVRDATLVASLFESLAHEPVVEIGPLFLWRPDPKDRPARGRYENVRQAEFLVIDGQKRLTALLAGLGERPPWWDETRWQRVGGPGLEIGLAFFSSGDRLEFVPMKDSAVPLVPLRVLLAAHNGGNLLRVLTREDVHGPQDFLQPVVQLLDRLLNASILLAWVHGDVRDAFEAFRRRNAIGFTTLLPRAQIDLCQLSLRAPNIVDGIDALMLDMAEQGLAGVFTLSAVNELIQRGLPPTARRRHIDRAREEDIVAAVADADHGARLLAEYVRERGVITREFVVQASAFQVLAHLFVQFNNAAQDDFASRWLAQAQAQDLFVMNDNHARSAIAALNEADTYAQAQNSLSDLLRHPPVTAWPTERLHRRDRRHFGSSGLLYAMAQAAGTEGRVRDLAHPDRVFPATEMHLAPLWPQHRDHFATYILAGADTAAVLHRHGGWNRAALDDLGCGDDVLATQFIPVPSRIDPAQPAETMIKSRAQQIAAFLSRFLAATAR
ncbi:hypothetical protein ACFVVA_41420 [Kitasatospora sp. NPDC058048]|uniref:hypothetical protein n=1 Tax=Kitasatospora sp. NPDC058048 TaxID=3346313 RepID=UPI0036D9740C